MSDINNQFNKILIHRLLNFQQFQILPPQRAEIAQKYSSKKLFCMNQSVHIVLMITFDA